MFGRTRPTRTTVSELAERWAKTASERINRLLSEIKTRNLYPEDPRFTERLNTGVECAIFEWFLFDILIWREFGPHADAIRERLELIMLKEFQRVGVLPEERDRLIELKQIRFTEYTGALKSDPSGVGLERLSALAWDSIQAKEQRNPVATMLLATEWASVLGEYRGIGDQFEIVP